MEVTEETVPDEQGIATFIASHLVDNTAVDSDRHQAIGR
jgi:hypothetical protein